MATVRTVTVKASGGDYTTLAAAIAAEAGNLVTLDRQLDILCDPIVETIASSLAISSANYTTDAERFIRIRGVTNHNGSKSAGYRLRSNASFGYTLNISTAYVYLENFVAELLPAEGSLGENSAAINYQPGTQTAMLFMDKMLVPTSARRCVSAGSGLVRMRNSVLVSQGSASNAIQIGSPGNTLVHSLHNCVFVARGSGQSVWHAAAGTIQVKNCYSFSNTGQAYRATAAGTFAFTNAASDDTTGSAALQNVALDTATFTSVTSGSEDFHLPSGSPLIAAGADLLADALLPVTEDIDGAARSAPFDIGVDETAPVAAVLSNPGRDTITATSVRVTFDSSSAAPAGYVVVTTSDTPPSAAQIKAGSGGSIVASASGAFVSGANARTVSGLSPSTAYYAYALADTGADSNILAIPTFTTTAAAPTLSSAAINAGGTQLTLTHSAAVGFGAGGNGGVTLAATNGAVTASYASGAGSTALVYTLSRTVFQGETVTVSYTQPGNGIEHNTEGVDVASYSNAAVTNSSTVQAPAVSAVSTPSPARGASLTITGTNFGASQGAGGVTIGGVAQTVTAWADTSITVTVVRGTNKYGVALGLVVTSNPGYSSPSFGLTSVTPQSGWQFVNIGTPNATAANRLEATPDIASGDQVAWGNVAGSGAVTVTDDASFNADAGVTAFDFEVHNAPDGWGSVATQTVEGATLPASTGVVAVLAVN